MDDLLVNPWINLGLGILGASGPGVPGAQAIGRGGLLGMESLRQQQQAQEMQRYRQAQALAAQQKAMQAQQESQRLEDWISTLPPDQQAAARAGLGKQVYTAMNAKPTLHTMQEGSQNVGYMYDPASRQYVQIASGPKWNPQSGMGLRVGPDGSIEFGTGAAWAGRTPLSTPIDKTESRKLRQKAREYNNLEKDAVDLLDYVDKNPGAAGAIPRAKKFIGSWTEQAGDFLDSPALKEAGAGMAGDLALYKLRARTLINSSKAVLLDDQGRISDRDQAILDEAGQALELATTDREVKLVVNDLRRKAAERKAALGYGGGGQGGAPSGPPPAALEQARALAPGETKTVGGWAFRRNPGTGKLQYKRVK